MKFTSTLLAAGLAAGASAESWDTWASASTTTVTKSVPACPKKIVKTVTVTESCAEVTSDVYEKTVTVDTPDTKTVKVYGDGKPEKHLWDDWKAPVVESCPTAVPTYCDAKSISTYTSTVTESVKKTGSTVTLTKSILYVWDGKVPKNTVTITVPGAAPTPEWSSWNGNGNNGDGNKKGGDYNGGGYYGGDKDSDNKGGYKGGNGGKHGGNSDGLGVDLDDHIDLDKAKLKIVDGKRIGKHEKIVGSGEEVFHWDEIIPQVSKTFAEAPVYTKKPDGSYGWDWKDGSDWSDWKDGSKGGEDDEDESGGHGGKGTKTSTSRTSKPTGHVPGKNETTNGTYPEPGSPSSNLTKPFEPLKDYCNSPGSRGSWCGGKSIEDDIYANDYYTGETKNFDLTITNTTLSRDGEETLILAINGDSPGPLIEANWGDMVQITIHNKLQNNGTSIHWHGIRQVGTNDQDGVPGITECPIAPGESRTFTWHASSYGTTWYHSHWVSQYGDGLYGPIVIHGPATADYDVDAGVVSITENFPLTASQWGHLIAHSGPKGTSNYLLNGRNTKPDLSAGQHAWWKVQKGKKYLFRFCNSASQDMYSVSLDNHKMQVIAADFTPIVPYETEWLNIGIGQRYDVVIEMDQEVDSYFLRAVAQLGCFSRCDNTGLGQANGIVAYEGVSESPLLLPTSTTKKTASDFQFCADEPLASLVPHVTRNAGSKTKFQTKVSTIPADPVDHVTTDDDGTVSRWYLNGGSTMVNFTQPTLKTLYQQGNTSLISNPIVLNVKNEWVYFIIQNNFVAAHPMHLHGHDFSLLGQGQGTFTSGMADSLNFANPIRRDTAMLAGSARGSSSGPGYTIIGFETDNPGAWLMHCHIIWHVDGGLALQWIERPKDIAISEYVDSEFLDTCSAYEKYEAENPSHKKTSGMSGLRKKSLFFDEQVAKVSPHQYDQVVRRSDSAEKRYLHDRSQRRGIGNKGHFRR